MNDDLLQQRRSVTSAMYYMVLHLGLSYDLAERVIEESKAALEEFAHRGRVEGRMCFLALAALCDRENARHFKRRPASTRTTP